ncbi:MAG: DUF1540 domain-containing protein [Clostridia bacterium]|nr:DUF1540 domain-containing protein [Clostridia bacterium]
MEKSKKTEKSIFGEPEGQIVCRVQNCAYHCGDCTCTANRIAVGPTYASSGKDTVCATFKPKEL